METDSKQKTILCVDDDEHLLRALMRLLRSSPYDIVTANSGEEAVSIVSEKKPDLILLDVNMPRMSGIEVLRFFREQGQSDIPIVMLTGDKSEDDILKGYCEGCMYYITKPFKNEYVLNIINYLIGDLSEPERAKLEAQL